MPNIIDANGNTINYVYDENNHLIIITYPLSTVHYGYDATGKRTSMTDWQGTTQYLYDALNRLITVDGPEANDTITYAYDQTGNRISMVNQDGGLITYIYDTLNRLVSLTDPSGKITNYSYDNVSNITKMAYPNNTQASYNYDQLNRLIELANEPFSSCHSEPRHNRGEESNKKAISSYDYNYNTAGMRTKVTLGGRHSERSEESQYIEYEYDGLNRLTKEAKYQPHKWGDKKHLLYSYEYTFDAVGNRITMRRNLHQPLFWGCMNDDLMDDIKNDICRNNFRPESDESDDDECKCSCKETPYKPVILTKYTYNEENQLLLEEEGIEWKNKFISLKKTEYTYDNNGNQISKTISRGCKKWQRELVTTYEYDYENRLTKITYADGTTSEYKYDGVGKRVQSIENGTVTKYLYDGLNVIIERDNLDNTTAFYHRGLSYGGGIGGIIRSEQNRLIRYYCYDGLGTVTGLTDAYGLLVQSYQYDAYGNLLFSAGKDSNPYLFSTKEYDSKSGLSYFGARYYDSKVGRFITKDIWPANLIVPSSFNRYVYVENNPINWIDLWGLQRLSKEEREDIRRLYEQFQEVGTKLEDMWRNWKPGQTWEDYSLTPLANAAGYRSPQFNLYPQSFQNAVNAIEDNWSVNWMQSVQLAVIGGHGYWNPLNWVFRQSGYAESQWWLTHIAIERFRTQWLLNKLQKILEQK